LFLGFQHAIAMVGGIATSGGYLIANDACLAWQRDSEMCERKSWLISCAWLASGLLSIIQIFRMKIKGTPFYLGTGLISMMGTSFTFLPIACMSRLTTPARLMRDPHHCVAITACNLLPPTFARRRRWQARTRYRGDC
jgi:xanthine/uracil permease